MAYKFQLGAARLSGSVIQEGQITSMDAAVSASTSIIIGNADLNETDLEKIDGITNGTVAANKAVVVDASSDFSGYRNISGSGNIQAGGNISALEGNVTAGGSFIIGDADLNETDMEKLDGITNGTVAANKAVVVDGSKDASGFRNVSGSGNFQVGGNLSVLEGNVTAGGSFIIGDADLNETDMEKLDGITNGTVAANKAVVVDGSKDASGFRNISGSGTAQFGGNVSILEGALNLNEVTLGDGTADGFFGQSGNNKQLKFGSDNNFALYYDEAQTDGLVIAGLQNKEAGVYIVADEADDPALYLVADQGDGAGDAWKFMVDEDDNHKLIIGNDIASQGTSVAHLTITPNSTVANSTAAFAGNVTVAGNLTINGTTTTVNSTTVNITSSLTFEGPADAHESTLSGGEPTQDNTFTLPQFSGSVPSTYHFPVLADAATALSAQVTAAEFALLDGASTPGTTALADNDGFLHNDDGTMRQTRVIKIAELAFSKVSGDIAIASNGGATIQANAVEGSMLNNNAISGLTDIGDDIADTDEFMISDNGNLRRMDASRLKTYVGADTLTVVSGSDGVTLAKGLTYFDTHGAAISASVPNNLAVGESIKIKAGGDCSVSNSLTIALEDTAQDIDGENQVVLESPFAAIELVYVVSSSYRIF